ncbi:GtrA family protein [uncultured Kordia sp.]|uniref:GtrA family protein n=1 Tax=uncultured Kordia sp. TaxID=507699 RepID=UPI002617B418|nr:GtrA family protein [uncultured Kordia sp.]
MTFNFYKQSENVRMLVIATIGMILSLLTYEIIYYLNPFSPKATISWTIAFIIGTARQHALHRYFTFLHKGSYFKSLYRAYIVDIGGLVFTTGLNWFLSEFLQVHHRFVWACCVAATALIGLVFLKKYIFKPVANAV